MPDSKLKALKKKSKIATRILLAENLYNDNSILKSMRLDARIAQIELIIKKKDLNNIIYN